MTLNAKEARYLIRLGHSGRYTPAQHPELLGQLRARLQPISGAAINLRISRAALEFDLFCPPASELHPFLGAVESIGPVLTYRRLDLPPAEKPAGELFAEARALFKEERYWEVHEVLEGLWKKATGEEKRLIQGFILTAAALVHAQRNEIDVVDSLLDDAILRLENQPRLYHGMDVHRFLSQVRKIKIAKTYHFPTI
jgi:hypothetical protein